MTSLDKETSNDNSTTSQNSTFVFRITRGSPTPSLNDSICSESSEDSFGSVSDDRITQIPSFTSIQVNSNCSAKRPRKNPKSVARRNARERRRIKNVNSAFDELRLHVPSGEVNRKKISKVSCNPLLVCWSCIYSKVFACISLVIMYHT